jgi:hypothetical protein
MRNKYPISVTILRLEIFAERPTESYVSTHVISTPFYSIIFVITCEEYVGKFRVCSLRKVSLSPFASCLLRQNTNLSLTYVSDFRTSFYKIRYWVTNEQPR